MIGNWNSNPIGNVEIFLSFLLRRLLSEVMSATMPESSTEWLCNCSAAWWKDFFFFYIIFLVFCLLWMAELGSYRTLVYIHNTKRLTFTIPCSVDVLHSLVYAWTISECLQKYANKTDCTDCMALSKLEYFFLILP